ncbi:urea amidolyase associated protein UAAP1 [Sulfurospirillum halorespirans]|uniref:Urea carboxylase accessory protein n=1 Tax=Sulfurospirillum halorespirans DSM 13726 TaxID=1193502 RepID=A0A1D7TNC2_9BACT|nr:urea amidolyase associated protein UAAP1 [Sulfurospirillum halorespirans]AOO66499.1 urea carboxylase accessory protein [Sulfurospirillum halorespirans DSM 13726]
MIQESIVLNEVITGGGKWSKLIKRGQTIRFSALDDKASLSALFYNADNTAERYNSADTVKIQWNAFLGKGKVLFSELGHVLFSITEDTTHGLIDTLAGMSNPRIVEQNFGSGSYEQIRNRYFKSDRENFLVELGKYGMGKRDIVQCLNLFRKVDVAEGSQLLLSEKRPKKGDYIELRAEMNILLVLSNTPHVMEKGAYNPSDVEVSIFERSAKEDVLFSEEAKRGFENNARYFA